MENKINLQCNRIIHLEDSMVMYGIYNLETLEKLIYTVHKMHNSTTLNEKLFASKPDSWYCHTGNMVLWVCLCEAHEWKDKQVAVWQGFYLYIIRYFCCRTK